MEKALSGMCLTIPVTQAMAAHTHEQMPLSRLLLPLPLEVVKLPYCVKGASSCQLPIVCESLKVWSVGVSKGLLKVCLSTHKEQLLLLCLIHIFVTVDSTGDTSFHGEVSNYQKIPLL